MFLKTVNFSKGLAKVKKDKQKKPILMYNNQTSPNLIECRVECQFE